MHVCLSVNSRAGYTESDVSVSPYMNTPGKKVTLCWEAPYSNTKLTLTLEIVSASRLTEEPIGLLWLVCSSLGTAHDTFTGTEWMPCSHKAS